MLARTLRTKKEQSLYKIALVFSLLCWALVILSLIGALYGLLIAAGVAVAHALWLAHVRGNGVRISVDQLPQLAARIRRASEKLGLEQPPEAYVLQAGGTLNALATRLFSRQYIIIFSDLIDACEAITPSLNDERKEPTELDFIIAHELGHIACRHLSWLLLPARLVPLLGPAYSRACEYTCDACGQAVVGELETASRALAILAGGPTVGERMDLQAYAEQRAEAAGFWMAVYELNASHPYLSKRVAALQERANPGAAPVLGRTPWSYPLAPLFAFASGGVTAGAMMVLLVIGVMAAVAIPSFTRYVARSKAMQTQAATLPAERPSAHDSPGAAARAPAARATTSLLGDRFAWSLDVPAGWEELPPAYARKQNPLADRWLTQPESGAHIMVIAERAPAITLGALEDVVLAQAKNNIDGFQLLHRTSWRRRSGGGVLLETRGQVQDIPITYYYGLAVEDGLAYQVVAFAQTPTFAQVQDELLQVLSSFQPLTPRAAAP